MTSGEVTVGGTIGQRPDGKHVGVFTMATDNCSFQVALPADALDSMGAKLGPMLGDLATAVRRADSPLLVAKSVPTPGGKKK